MRKVLTFLVLFFIFIHADEPKVKHILVLHSYNETMSWVQDINKAIEDVLKPSQNNYVIHIENMDTKIIYSKNYLESLRKIYAIKYKDMKLDLILSSDNNAFDFLKQYRDELFRDTPVVFCGVNNFKKSDLDGFKNVTGVAEVINAKNTLEMALHLLPKTQEVFIINDYLKTGRAWERDIKKQLQGYNKNIKLSYAQNSSIQELQETFSKLPKKTIILYGVYFKDKNGVYISYEKMGEMIANSAKNPVFSLLEFNTAIGVVGGDVISGYSQGEAMSKIAQKILMGKKASEIAVLNNGISKYVFNYNELQKFGIDIHKLPSHSIILNKPVSFYEKNRMLLLVGLFLVTLLLTIIVLLLVNKKRVEQLVEEKVGNFNLMFMNMPIGLGYVSAKGEILMLNRHFKKLFGYDEKDIPTLAEWWDLAYPDEEYRKSVLQRWNDAMQKSIDSGEDIEPVIYNVTCKSGDVRIVEISGTTVGLEFIATFIDLTERIKAENQLKQSNEKLLGLYKLSPLGIALTDMEGKYIEFNDAFVKICGYPANELQDLGYWDLTPEKYKDQEALQLDMLQKTGHYGPYEKEYRQKDGTLIPINLNGLIVGSDETQKYIWSIVEDISKRKEVEKISRLRNELSDLVRQKDRDALLRHALDTAEEMTRSQIGFFHFVDADQENVSLQVWSTNTLQKMCFAEGHSTHYPISQAGVWVDCVHQRKAVIHNDYESLTHKKGLPTGHAPLIRELVVPVFQNDLIVAIIGIGNKEKEYDQHDVEIVEQIADIAYENVQRLEIERQIKHLAYYDSLTNLPNRTLFSDRLNQAIASHKRAKKYLAVCFMDLDGFKPINDQYGHEVGDKLLIALANRIGLHLREIDTFARLGGDEFVLIITEMNKPDEYVEVIERIIGAVKVPFEIEKNRIHVSCSVGITIYPIDEADGDTLLRHADQAMYQAKEDLQTPYKVYKSIEDENVKTYNKLIEEFSVALKEDQLVLHYQPKVNLRDATVIGVEALIRWQHPTRGLLFPNEFLHIIQDTPLEIKLDEWVMKKAFEQRAEFEKNSLELTISINISPRNIQLESFSDFVCELLLDYDVDFAQKIEFEILEVSNIENIEVVKENMLKCSQVGITFSLDDFGTGYSSLVHFHSLPINILKIDQNFVKDMLVDSNDLGIVEGVLQLADTLKRPVVAEGVESIEIGLMLLYLGCQYAQGYGIAKPMPKERLYTWLNFWNENSIWHELQNETSLDSSHYDINVAIFSHRKWLANAIDFITRFPKSDKTPLDEINCQFEHWYKGIGRTRYGDRESYAFVQAKHNKVHQFVTYLIELANSGQKQKAIAEIDKLRMNANELIDLLQELARQK